jgi:hypothetical protein
MKKTYIICMALLGLTCSAGNLTIKVEPSEMKTSMSSFEEDHLDLVLREGTNVLDRFYLYSSYGLADAKLITDAAGTRYALVRHGKGRGTHVRQEFISVFKVRQRLTEVVRFPLNGPAGDRADWEYSYEIKRQKKGGLKFVMSLRVTGRNATYFPEDKKRTIVVD